MFHHRRTLLKQALFVVHLTRNSFQCSPLYRQHGWEGGESLLQQRHSRYFTINVKPLLFVIGKTWLQCCCCCCCHILICSPLWKTLVSINFTFMVCTHNKWVWGVVYQQLILLSNLKSWGKKLLNYDMFGIPFFNNCKFRFLHTNYEYAFNLKQDTSLAIFLLVFRLTWKENSDIFFFNEIKKLLWPFFLKPAAPLANSKPMFTPGVT